MYTYWVSHHSAANFAIPSLQRSEISWLFSAAASTDVSGSQLVGKVIDGVNHLIRDKNFRTLDMALEAVPKRASKHVLVALARSSFPVRTKLVGWQSFIHELKHAFDARQLDGAKLLNGMI